MKEGLNYGCLENGLNITEKLVEDYIEANMQSKIVQWMNDPAHALPLAGTHLYDMPAEHLRDYYKVNTTVNIGGFEQEP